MSLLRALVGDSAMSCLPSDALSHFEQREQELLALDQQLEQKRARALAEASTAVRDAESSSLHTRVYRSPEDTNDPEQVGADPSLITAMPPRSASRPSSASAKDAGGLDGLHTTIRFQAQRIVALQGDLDKALAELASRDGEIQQLRADVKQTSEENKRLQKAGSSGEQSQERVKKQLDAAQAKLHNMEREKAEFLKEKDQFELKFKKSEAECSTKEARINRLAEELEKCKAQLRETSGHEKDRAQSDRKETERLTNEVRKLERQRAELVSAFKKQMRLIDVLKRQRAHMEAARVLSFTEDEFIRILELGDKLEQ